MLTIRAEPGGVGAGDIGPAHEKDIVHRDLKPVNVKATPEGKVKFGYIEFFDRPIWSRAPSVHQPSLRVGDRRVGFQKREGHLRAAWKTRSTSTALRRTR